MSCSDPILEEILTPTRLRGARAQLPLCFFPRSSGDPVNPQSIFRSALLVSVGLATTSCSVLEDSLFGVYFVKLKAEPAEVVGIVQDIANELAVEPIHIFDAAGQGFSVRLPNSGELISEIENLPVVARVIRDEKVDKLPPRRGERRRRPRRERRDDRDRAHRRHRPAPVS